MKLYYVVNNMDTEYNGIQQYKVGGPFKTYEAAATAASKTVLSTEYLSVLEEDVPLEFFKCRKCGQQFTRADMAFYNFTDYNNGTNRCVNCWNPEKELKDFHEEMVALRKEKGYPERG